LIRSGYRKNHFAHFARSEDHNLYYTHTIRGEDLLAIGTTADGVFGDYHYRHPDYKPYILTKPKSGVVSLEGGIRESALEWRVRPIVAALMGGYISMDLVQDFHLSELLSRWLERTLLRQYSNGKEFMLTANGSWVIDSMISELRTCFQI